MLKFLNTKILNGQSQTITGAAFVLAAASIASRLLGLVRDRLLAGTFGAGDTLDVYYAAFRVPDLVYNLLITGALSAGFIPVFVSLWKGQENITSPLASSPTSRSGQPSTLKIEGEILPSPPFQKEGREEAWRFVNSLLNILLIALVAAGALFFIFTPQLMRVVTPGFIGAKFDLTVALTRIMFLSPLLLGLSSIWGGVLQSLKRFFIFSLAPIFYNLGIIFGIIFLVPRLGVYGLAWGVVLGALLHMVIQLPALFSLGFKYQAILDWRDEGVRRLARLMVPRTLTLAVSQLNFVAITILASLLAAGSLAIFNLAYNIWTFPLGILAASLATAAFPALSQSAAGQDRAAFAKTFSATFRQILFLLLPAGALLIILRAQIVRVILSTGKFNWSDTIFTIDTLQYLTWGLFAEGLILLLVRGFFAWEDTKTPFWLGLISSLLRIGGAWWFSLTLGVAGLALGWALGGIFNMILLWMFLEKKIGDLRFGEVFVSGVKIILAAGAAALAAYWVLRLADRFVDTHTLLGLLEQGTLAGISGLVTYFLAAWLLRSPEMQSFWQSIKNHLPFKIAASDKEIIES